VNSLPLRISPNFLLLPALQPASICAASAETLPERIAASLAQPAVPDNDLPRLDAGRRDGASVACYPVWGLCDNSGRPVRV
jgi:hypothetical protein